MIGVALIGCGRAGLIHARNLANRIEGACLTALSDPVREALENAGKELCIDNLFDNYEDILSRKDVDAVYIASPTKYHCEIAVAAAHAGKHIFCEKPMAMTESECDKMISAAEANGVMLQVGFMRRFDDSYTTARSMIDEGEIGDVVLIKSHTRGPSTPKEWMYDIRKSNGPLAEVNSHDIDTLRWFSSSEFASVYAVGGNYRCPQALKEYPDFYDNVLLTGKFKNGCQGCIDGAQGVGYGYDAECEVLGTRGVIHIGRTQEKFITAVSKDGFQKSPYVTSWQKLFLDAYYNEDAAFIDSIRTGTPPRVSGIDGKMAVRVVNAGNLSICENRIVEL